MISKSEIPVMGVNTFDGYGWSITEKEFMDKILFYYKNLKPSGYRYMFLDFMWSAPGRDHSANSDQDTTFAPWIDMGSCLDCNVMCDVPQ